MENMKRILLDRKVNILADLAQVSLQRENLRAQLKSVNAELTKYCTHENPVFHTVLWEDPSEQFHYVEKVCNDCGKVLDLTGEAR